MVLNYIQVIAIILFFNTAFCLGLIVGMLIERNKTDDVHDK